MSEKEMKDLLNSFIDDYIDMYSMGHCILKLIDLGCTKEEIVNDLGFDESDVDEVIEKINGDEEELDQWLTDIVR